MNAAPSVQFNQTAEEIKQVCQELQALLIKKNESYGDSALNPVRIFSKSDSLEQIKVRMDDKLSRLAKGNGDTFSEDVELDLLGYLVLHRIARLRQQRLAPVGQ